VKKKERGSVWGGRPKKVLYSEGAVSRLGREKMAHRGVKRKERTERPD